MAELLNDDKASGNAKAASVRIGSDTLSGYSGQRRHDLRIGPQPNYVDLGRGPLNRVLMEYPRPAEMRRIAVERRAIRETSRAMKSNAAIATVGVITFGSEAAQIFERLSPDQQDAAFRELAEAVASRLQTSIHGLTVHLDESTIHAHFVMASYDHAGNPLSQTTRPQVLSELQDLTAEVMQRYCPEIERGTRYGDRLAAGADFADVMHLSVRELHRKLPQDLAKKKAEVADVGAALTHARERVEEMQGRVAKLLAKERDLTAAEEKRLAVYENRLADRQTEATKIEQAVINARAEVERLAELAKKADRAREESERRAEAVEAEALAKTQKAERMASKSADLMRASVALVDEMAAGTLRRSEDGKIVLADADAIRPGWPDIKPALIAGADARAQIEAESKALQKERLTLVQERQEVNGLRETLTGLIDRVRRFLGRPEVSRHTKVHEEGLAMTKTVMEMLRKPTPAPTPASSPTPKKTIEDPDDGPSGP